MGNLIDLTGKRFGRLSVVGISPNKSKSRGAMWECECDCGRHHTVTSDALRRGLVKSCGCLHDELSSKRCKTTFGIVDGTSLTMIATKTPYSNSKSGIRGVFFHKAAKKWKASLMVRGKTMNLGLYDTKEEAAKARVRAEEEFFDPILEEFRKV